MRKLLTALSAGLILSAAFARSAGVPEIPNTYNMPAVNFPAPVGTNNWDTTGKYRIFPNINAAGTAIFVTIGQSKIANDSASGATPYVTTHGSPPCININPYQGPGVYYYDLNDPVVGASAAAGFHQAGWHGRLCDKLITAGKYNQVAFIPIAIAGSFVADWAPGGQFNPRIAAVIAFINANSLPIKGVLWQQGTADCINGTSGSAYQTSLQSVISNWRSFTGRSTDKWMIAEDTINGGGNTVCSAIETAQTTVGGQTNNFVGPNADTLGSPTDTDGTHYNNTGNDAIAGLWSTAIQANF